MANLAQTAKRLQSAINKRTEARILINTQQWFSPDKGRPVTVYIVKQQPDATPDKRTPAIELFRTYSHVQLVLWLRDYWYELNGWDVPQDNEVWEEMKQKYER